MDEISEDLVQRMVALVLAMDKDKMFGGYMAHSKHFRHAQDIAALLPKPVDPDLIEAREICQNSPVFWDTSPGVERDPLFALGLVVAAIKRGRELAGGAA